MKKRFFKFIAIMIAFVFVFPFFTSCKEDGVYYKTRIIKSATKFIEAIEECVKKSSSNGIKLVIKKDLDFSDVKNYQPLTIDSVCKIDGRGHTLSNLTIDSPTSENVGIVAKGKVIVEDLKIKNLNITYYGSGCVGGIVGYSQYNSSYSNVTIDGKIFAENAEYVGGIVGKQPFVNYKYDNSIEVIFNSCTNNAEIVGKNYVGGLGGYSGCWYNEDNVNNGQIIGKEYVGGLFGSITHKGTSTSSKNCKNTGTVTGTYAVGGLYGEATCAFSDYRKYKSNVNEGCVSGNNYVGGIAGIGDKVYFENCENKGKVSSNGYKGDGGASYSYTGGIAGSAYCVGKCVNRGEVSSIYPCVGGIVGYMENASVCNYNQNHGDVSSDSDKVGGIVGVINYKGDDNGLIFSLNTNYGIVSGAYALGGIVGFVTGENNCVISYNENIGTIKYTSKDYTSTVNYIVGDYLITPSDLETNTEGGTIQLIE